MTMNTETITGTLGTVVDLQGAADAVEATGGSGVDTAFRYRMEAAGLLSDLGHQLLAEADRRRSSASVQFQIACQRA